MWPKVVFLPSIQQEKYKKKKKKKQLEIKKRIKKWRKGKGIPPPVRQGIVQRKREEKKKINSRYGMQGLPDMACWWNRDRNKLSFLVSSSSSLLDLTVGWTWCGKRRTRYHDDDVESLNPMTRDRHLNDSGRRHYTPPSTSTWTAQFLFHDIYLLCRCIIDSMSCFREQQ